MQHHRSTNRWAPWTGAGPTVPKGRELRTAHHQPMARLRPELADSALSANGGCLRPILSTVETFGADRLNLQPSISGTPLPNVRR